MEHPGRISADCFMIDVAKDSVQAIIKGNSHKIQYSEKYYDETNEYRHVILPKEISKLLPKHRLMSEREWRSIGVQQSLGWEHYLIHRPEPHILCFRRPKNYQPPPQPGVRA
jgi:cyclin-dependent kinase regulatory subunit CKS1|eukprot:CAMPEP_0174294660 /NCGR_PEP_ID=MMETSP0809-20121228/42284_1 /TAXON_ID=73025 ORGANISM="Eutreptiella gymnastica-like, Strain CCMP1594" /NCGR_SAMPLE_ID=MMETSP0809 /ASSEMBLY_ACC=CAM_ASM_000658 /LENGTH=111 /DNA_ID=CAMNT_0015396279 /DNA_START=66 /DNA_END=401 /DNA_ORIENTATION=-